MISSVKYLYAKDQFGAPVAVDQTRASELYFCIGCDTRMTPRRGRKVTHHYAHHRSSDCSGDETALHKIGKRLIHAGYSRARQAGEEFKASVNCAWPKSYQPHPALFGDLRSISNSSVLERKLSGSPYVPDILLLKDDQPAVVIEVEVTNPLSEAKRVYYARRDLPVLIVRPNWDNVWRLERGVWADEMIPSSLLCPAHADAKEESERRQLERERFRGMLLARMLGRGSGYRS